jgi:hypothetical protein
MKAIFHCVGPSGKVQSYQCISFLFIVQGDANLSQEMDPKDKIIITLVIIKYKAFLLTDPSVFVKFRQTYVTHGNNLLGL